LTPEPFTLHVPDEVLDDLRVRLERTIVSYVRQTAPRTMPARRRCWGRALEPVRGRHSQQPVVARDM